MKKANEKDIAKDRIVYLFRLAQKAMAEGDKSLAKRYVSLALQIGMKFQVSMPREWKRSYCKNCGVYWVPGKTVMVRSKKKGKYMIFTCLDCGAIRRHPYIKESFKNA
jgi:ribonuclease P protein subunit RPR2